MPWWKFWDRTELAREREETRQIRGKLAETVIKTDNARHQLKGIITSYPVDDMLARMLGRED